LTKNELDNQSSSLRSLVGAAGLPPPSLSLQTSCDWNNHRKEVRTHTLYTEAATLVSNKQSTQIPVYFYSLQLVTTSFILLQLLAGNSLKEVPAVSCNNIVSCLQTCKYC